MICVVYTVWVRFFLRDTKQMNAPPLSSNTVTTPLSPPVWGDLAAPDSLAVTVSACLISLVAAASANYLPQSSQYQYSILPPAVFVAALAGICFRLA